MSCVGEMSYNGMLSLHGKPFVHSSVHSKKSRGTPPPPLPACEAAVSTGGGGAVDGCCCTQLCTQQKVKGYTSSPPYLPVRQLWYRACLCVALCSPMDKAPDFWSGDCRFESCQVRVLSPPRSWGAKPPQLITTDALTQINHGTFGHCPLPLQAT